MAGVHEEVEQVVHEVERVRSRIMRAANLHSQRRQEHAKEMSRLQRRVLQLASINQTRGGRLELNGSSLRLSALHNHIEPTTEEDEAKYLEAGIRASLSLQLASQHKHAHELPRTQESAEAGRPCALCQAPHHFLDCKYGAPAPLPGGGASSDACAGAAGGSGASALTQTVVGPQCASEEDGAEGEEQGGAGAQCQQRLLLSSPKARTVRSGLQCSHGGGAESRRGGAEDDEGVSGGLGGVLQVGREAGAQRGGPRQPLSLPVLARCVSVCVSVCASSFFVMRCEVSMFKMSS